MCQTLFRIGKYTSFSVVQMYLHRRFIFLFFFCFAISFKIYQYCPYWLGTFINCECQLTWSVYQFLSTLFLFGGEGGVSDWDFILLIIKDTTFELNFLHAKEVIDAIHFRLICLGFYEFSIHAVSAVCFGLINLPHEMVSSVIKLQYSAVQQRKINLYGQYVVH